MSDQHAVPLSIDRARLKGVLAVKSISFTAFAVSVGISSRHLELVVAGKRPMTAQVADGIQCTLGDAAWRFVTGRASTLSTAE